AARAGDLAAFDAAFFGHVSLVFQNAIRSLTLALSSGRLARRPMGGEAGQALGQISRFSASFALVADVCLATLGGGLKRKEMLSGRLADALTWMYVASASVRRFVDEGQREEHRPAFRWAIAQSLYEIEQALGGVLDNLPNRAAALALRPLVFPLGKRRRSPGDRVVAAAARSILDGGSARETLASDLTRCTRDRGGLERLERALALTIACEGGRRKLRDLVKSGVLPRAPAEVELAELARAKGLLAESEAGAVREAALAREAAIQVDAFAREELAQQRGPRAPASVRGAASKL